MLCAAALLLHACAPQSKERQKPSATQPEMVLNLDVLSGVRALEEVRALVELGPRDAGTTGARKAADHLLARLRSYGLNAWLDSFEELTPVGKRTFHNVMAGLPGRQKGLIILGSHFDTKSGIGDGFQGANDSGSSSGLLLEMAHVLALSPTLDPEILLVFFDGEECMHGYGRHDGLHGSKHLARTLVEQGRADKVRFMLLLDMIGDRDLTVTLPQNNTTALNAAVFAAARAENARNHFSLYAGGILDDHVPFLDAGMPACNIIDFQFGSHPRANDYWHTMEDSMNKLSAESLQIVGRVALRMINDLSQQE